MRLLQQPETVEGNTIESSAPMQQWRVRASLVARSEKIGALLACSAPQLKILLSRLGGLGFRASEFRVLWFRGLRALHCWGVGCEVQGLSTVLEIDGSVSPV